VEAVKQIISAFVVVVVLAVAPTCLAKSHPPAGVLAASVGDTVVMVEAGSGLTASVDTGPVGWLYPAPGGLLFAPDVVDGRTTVIDLRTQQVSERLDGLTMPYFGESGDRYIALAGETLLVSYPQRALIARIGTEITNPWQVIIAPDDSALLVLERLPDGSTGTHISTVNLISRQPVARQPLPGDVVHMALSSKIGLLALADAAASRVRLVAPGALSPVADRPLGGRPVDIAFADDGGLMATAVAVAGDGGVLDLATFKRNKHGLRLTKEHAVPLATAPVRLAVSPDGRYLAVALDDGAVIVLDADKKEVVARHRLPGAPRDLRWCDPTRPGPIQPEWSEDDPAELDLEPFKAPKGNRSQSGFNPHHS